MIALLALLITAQPTCDPAGPQMAMNACARDDFIAADRELNRVWAQVIVDARRSDAEINRAFDSRPPREQFLREGQRAWILYRDAWCTAEGMAEARGGSMEPMSYEGCRATVTRARTRELRGQGAE